MNRIVKTRDALSGGCFLLLCLAAVPGAFAAKTITIGPADISSKADFQAVLDGASSGARIRLKGGVYDFSAGGPPMRITKSVTIENAGGSAPVFVGTGDLSDGATGPNVGLVVDDQDEDINGLTIKGIEFRDFARAINISPQESIAEAGECGLKASGVVRHLRIRNNHFEDNDRGIQSFGGGLDRFDISSNTFAAMSRGIVLVGEGTLFCDDPPFEYVGGSSSDGKISGNSFEDGTIDIVAANMVNLDVRRNDHRDSFLGVVAIDHDNFSGVPHTISVTGSVFTNASFIGVLAGGTAATRRNRLANNTYVDNRLPVVLDEGATRYTISNETFEGSLLGIDIYLCPDDTGDDFLGVCLGPAPIGTKVIITDPDTVLVDLANGTKVLGQP